MPLSPTARALRATLAGKTRWEPDKDHTALRQKLKAQTLEEHVRDVLASAPPLTDEQKQKIAALFGGA